jgi:hypothetical protein
VQTVYEVTIFGEVRLVSITLDARRHDVYFMTTVSTLESMDKVQVLRFPLKKVTFC